LAHSRREGKWDLTLRYKRLVVEASTRANRHQASGKFPRKEIVATQERKAERGSRHVPPGEGSKSLWVFGELVTYKVTSAQTGGAYSLFEVATRPGGGPSPHVQHREDESFYVLEGEYEFLDDDGRIVRAGPGSLFYVPRGNLHSHTNVGERYGRALICQTPGGLHESFFEEIGEPATNRSRSPASAVPSDLDRIVEVAAKYGIEIPPLRERHTGERGWRREELSG
jgi:mannose-6-phosphate isomerase-like protein (cupin superfamily)